MRKLLSALLYTAIIGLANISHADVSKAEDMRAGDMRKLIFHSAPMDTTDVAFMGENGQEMTLADYAGKTVVLNFWATWCNPCRTEMPHLSALQDQLGSDTFEVVTVATGRNPIAGMQRFFEEVGVDNLPLHTDAQQGFARNLGVLGLPATLIIDPEGRELGRMLGEADWSSDNAIAILQAIMGTDG
jgi:thiol-disulfide isomerase/thioredoxin